MKKFLKNNIKLILVFLLGIIVSSGITAYAVNSYMSEQIRYQNNTFAINSVSEALDDLYSYSKEKIDNNTSNNYSTEEQVVGTWIDGKKVYQKTIVGNLPSSVSAETWITLFSINNVDFVIPSIKAELITPNNEYVQLGYATAGENTVNVRAKLTNNVCNIQLYTNQGPLFWLPNIPIYITIQYTKTTDTATS